MLKCQETTDNSNSIFNYSNEERAERKNKLKVERTKKKTKYGRHNSANKLLL